MKEIKNVFYAGNNDARQTLDIYLPEAESFKIFIYFHGGGLKGGSKNGYGGKFAEYLTAHGICVVSAEYRMYPEARYPDFIEDAASAVAWVKNNIGSYGKSLGIYVGGSSAGGYLSMMLCFDPRWLLPFGELKIPVAGYFHNAGQPTAHFKVLKERGISSKRVIIDESAPLFHIGLEESYPPMHFVVSDNDMKCRYEQTMLVLATLRHFEYDEEKIGFTLFHGKHCEQNKTVDENGDNVLGKMMVEFVEKYR